MATETTPLLAREGETQQPAVLPPPEVLAAKAKFISPFRRLLLTCLLLSIAFIYTATPLIYAFRTITCDYLYEDGTLPPYTGDDDRCATREIESQTAADISLMVTFTTASGVLNLITTGWYMRRWGVRTALVMQTLWPCLRNVCQTFAVSTGGPRGIAILQWTQLITIFGGGAGYFLAANSYVAALVAPEDRTASFGIIQGVAMAGTAFGYTAGGLTGDMFGAPAPFQVTLILLILSTILSGVFLPYIPPASPPSAAKDGAKASGGGVFGFLSPLKVFLPRVIEKEDGGDGTNYWGLTFLGSGTFLGVLALAYVPLMLQLTATNAYEFGPAENGYLLSTNATVRAIFLMFAFPRIISRGRKWYTSRSASALPPTSPPSPLGTHAVDFEPPAVPGEEATEPILPPSPTDEAHGSQFDLFFVRCSMVLDGLLTGCMFFTSQGWHMYLAGSLIPLASGTAPASKGVVMDMVPAAQQPDALAAIALVEMLAAVITVSVFGILFAALSELGLARWTFVCNAGLAFFAASVLCLVRFPPKKKPAIA